MSLPWIKVYGSLFEHPRAVDLGDELGNPLAWAHLVALWSWCAEYAPAGVISCRNPERAIERGARWHGEAGRFVMAATLTGWLERDGETLRVCGWDEHQKPHLDKAAKDKKRLADSRAAVRAADPGPSRDERATTHRSSRDGSASVAGERRGEEKREEQEPVADAPVAVGGRPEFGKNTDDDLEKPLDLFKEPTPIPTAPVKKPKPPRARDPDMDAVLGTYEVDFGAPPGHIWTTAEVVQYRASRARWDVPTICRALSALALDPFNLKQPLHALLVPGKLETGLRTAKAPPPVSRYAVPEPVHAHPAVYVPPPSRTPEEIAEGARFIAQQQAERRARGEKL